MSIASFQKTKDGVQRNLQAMVQRGKSVSSFLQRVIFPFYQQAQINRWQSEGSSEGLAWEPLNPVYAKRKAKIFAAYPGAGRALMVATGKLAKGVQAQDSSLYYKLISDESMTISVNLGAIPYAPYPGVMRPYMTFSDDTTQSWKDMITKYLINGSER